MKVAVAVHGRFHAFELATQLFAAGLLSRLDTTYPAFAARRFLPSGLPLRTLPWLEAVRRVYPRLGLPGKSDLFIARSFARTLAANLPQADLLVGWSGATLEAISPARAQGMKIVLERGSTHIGHQTEILEQHHDRFGLKLSSTDPRLVERELAEYRLADFICTGSSHARQTFIDKGVPPHKVGVNPYGVDLTRFFSTDRAPTKRILFVGLVGIRKGVPWLVDAFQTLPHDWELHLVGPVERGFETVLQNMNLERVVLRGPLPSATIPAEMRSAAIFCLPSLEEGFGMVILQAMASGLPVVASTATGGPDAGTDGRDLLLVPPADTDALTQALTRMTACDDLRRTMGACARARVADGFAWSDYGARAIALYKRITGC